MGKGATRLELITQQNEMLKQQNDLLREQNELMRQTAAVSRDGKREIFVDNIDRDEMRSGFLVTSHKKKLWNVEIGLINEFARICKKHNLRWFAYAGTLLGAARHKGFIPWDDDIDVVMFRPDYEKFKSIIEDELKGQSKYHMWYWFNYRLETDTEAAKKVEPNLPLISKEQADKYPGWAPLNPLIRLIDSDTTYIMHDTRKNVFYATFLDVFCLDPCPPLPNENNMRNFAAGRELILATVLPEIMRKAIAANQKFFIPHDNLLKFLDLPFKQRALQYEAFLLRNFTRTPHISEMKYHSTNGKRITLKTADFDNIVYLPFENIELPAPANYDSVLTDFYGDWHKMIITHTHAQEYSTDVPYKEYFAKSSLINYPPPEFIKR